MVSCISWFQTSPAFVIADADIIKQITASRVLFPKPSYGELAIYGPNLVCAEGKEWTRHRKIAYPAFAESTIQCAFESTVRIVHDMFLDWSHQGDRVVLSQTETTMKDVRTFGRQDYTAENASICS